jgi:hypothetical protein
VFDRKGNYLFSTKSGTLIKIVTPQGIQTFSQFTADRANSKPSGKIVDYYKRDAGFNKGDKVGVDPNSSPKRSTAYTAYNPPVSNLSTQGGATDIVDNSKNLISILNHERNHKENGPVSTFQDHLDVYTAQMDDEKTFKPTSNSFKGGTAASFGAYLLGGVQSGEFDVITASKKVEDFNKKYAKYNVTLVITSIQASMNTMEIKAFGHDDKGKQTAVQLKPREDVH